MSGGSADARVARAALDLFEDALDWPPDTVATRLADLAVEQPQVATEVKRLLEVHAGADHAMPTDFSPVALVLPRRPPPDTIGQFRLRETLGAGGMGEVYRAERQDGLFEQVVAIKLLRHELDSAAARHRFDAERRLLARLRHPNIGQIYDGGTTADGRPYLIMEFVPGMRVDEYCRAQLADAGALLRLFVAICRAVQFAHQQLVVHADLKPSNVIVTQEGEPKLLDFGIARALDLSPASPDSAPGPASGIASASAAPQLKAPLTRAYASPARLAGAAPGVADDVYALGIILDQLLDSPKFVRTVDMRCIVARAAHADEHQRYATAAALADDIERLLAGRPVEAHPTGGTYRLRKYLRRNAAIVLLSGLGSLAVLGGLFGTTLQYRRAEAARVRAVRHFDQVRQLADYMLFDMNEKLRRTPGTLRLRQEVADVGQRYIEELAIDERAAVDVQLDALRGYAQLAALWGEPRTANLGDRPRALASLKKAYDLAKRLNQRAPGEDTQRALTRIALALARLSIVADGITAQVRSLLDEARGMIDLPRTNTPEWRILDAEWWIASADAADWESRYADAATHAARASSILTTPPLADIHDLAMERLRYLARQAHAESVFYSGAVPAAIAEYRSLVAMVYETRLEFTDDPTALQLMIDARYDLGTALLGAEQAIEAVEVIGGTLALTREMMQRDPQDRAAVRNDGVMHGAYAQALVAVRRFPEALDVASRLVDQRRALLKNNSSDFMAQRDYQTALVIQGAIQAHAGQVPAACGTFRAARDFMQSAGHLPLTKLDEATGLKDAEAGIATNCVALKSAGSVAQAAQTRRGNARPGLTESPHPSGRSPPR